MCLLFVLASCATVNTNVEPLAIKQRHTPDLFTVSKARVGEIVYEEFNYRETTLPSKKVLNAALSRRYMLGRIDLPVGSELNKSSGNKYCSVSRGYIDPLTGPYSAVCFIDADGDLQFEQFSVPLIAFGKANNLKNVIRYTEIVARKVMADAGGYKKELIFQGVDGSTIRFLYREYVNDLARPAFSQDLTYPISSTGSILFKDVKINVINVLQSEIEYQVESKGL